MGGFKDRTQEVRMKSPRGISLDTITDSSKVGAALLVDPRGRVEASHGFGDDGVTVSRTSESELLQCFRFVGMELGLGDVQCLLVENPGEHAAIVPVGPDATLILVGTQWCGLGQLRLEAARAARLMAEYAPTPTTPAAAPSQAQPPADRAAVEGSPVGLRGMAQLVAQRFVRGLKGGGAVTS
jgi:predicted regulator of Ras-like GTPase activity (Roadblock/LC7/MglB family)